MNISTGLLFIADYYDDLALYKTYLNLLWKWSIFTVALAVKDQATNQGNPKGNPMNQSQEMMFLSSKNQPP